MVVPLLIFAFFGILIGGSLILVARMLREQRQLAQEGGYSSLGDYLRAAPRSDKEKRDAADLALKGLVICLLGLLVPPLLAIGLFPFFFGARKVVYASMGLGLIDDADQSGPGRPAHGA
jgi:hypothetical protein